MLRTYRYCVMDSQTNEIIRTVTAQQLKKEYGISRVSEKITSNRGDNYILPDGNYLIEDYEIDEEFRRIVNTKNYVYYVSNHGYVYEVDKKTRERTKIKTFNKDSEPYFRDENNKLYNLANVVIHSFFPNLPKTYTIRYEDNNKENCSIDNLLVVPPRKNTFYEFLRAQTHS